MDSLFRPVARCVALLVAVLAVFAADPPEQPLPFSHAAHVGVLKLQCKLCHVNPDPGQTEGLPPAATCMRCHATVKTESPAIQKLAAYVRNNRPVPWVRVYEIPDYVNFSHRSHLNGGNTCEDCHGKVAESDRLARATDISMTGCMNCHKTKNAGVDCAFCHDPR